jgi:CRP-like cAMP-binding protein
MVEKSELLSVPAFADLPDDQIAWFISQSEELQLKAGDTYIREGDPADTMFVNCKRAAKSVAKLSYFQ